MVCFKSKPKGTRNPWFFFFFLAGGGLKKGFTLSLWLGTGVSFVIEAYAHLRAGVRGSREIGVKARWRPQQLDSEVRETRDACLFRDRI